MKDAWTIVLFDVFQRIQQIYPKHALAYLTTRKNPMHWNKLNSWTKINWTKIVTFKIKSEQIRTVLRGCLQNSYTIQLSLQIKVCHAKKTDKSFITRFSLCKTRHKRKPVTLTRGRVKKEKNANTIRRRAGDR